MTEADIIYNALLRAERRMEAIATDGNRPLAADIARPALAALQMLREEIGNGLSKDGR